MPVNNRDRPWIIMLNDLKYALRMLRKKLGFTSVAVLCLALGTGATAAIFSIVNTVLLRPLPYTKPERLIRIYSEFPTFPNGGLRRFAVSTPEFLDLRRETKSWESIDAWVNSGVNVAGKSEPMRITASFVSGGMLNALGVAPGSGRLITPSDDVPGAPLVANISHGLWQRGFGGDSNLVGQEILLNGRKCTVIGIMPKGFHFPPGAPDPPDVWTPIQIDPANPGDRGSHNLSLLGRLKPEIKFADAQAELESLVRHYGETGSGHRFDPTNHTVVSFGMQDEVVRGVRPALRMLFGAVCFVLLIACVNVANLLLARAESRQREIAIRSAMGAGLGRLAMQFVVEGLALSFLGAGLGLTLAYNGLEILKKAGEISIPRASEISIDESVLLFTVAVCVVTGVVFGLTPLMHVIKQKVYESLKSAAASTTGAVEAQRFRHVLVVAELALAVMLLVGTGLMIRAFWKLQEVDGGFRSSQVVTAVVSLPEANYRDGQTSLSFWSRLDQRLRALPGVEAAALVSGLPPIYPANYNDTQIEGFVSSNGGPPQNVDYYQYVSKDYFKTLGIRIVEGRAFDDRDGQGTPEVVVINQTMARTFWGNQSAIGRRLRPGNSGPWRTVIGVIADVKNGGLDKPTGTELYQLYNQQTRSGLSGYVAVRSPAKSAATIGAIRQALHEIDPALPLSNVRTMDEVVSAAQSRPRFLTLLLSLFSGVALVLASVGIYGVISYSVVQRTKEFGVRMALGARPTDVLDIVLKRGMAMAVLGVAIGVIGALSLTRFLATLLFGVTPTDPITFAAVAFLLAGISFVACYIPARRATKVDPMVALRDE